MRRWTAQVAPTAVAGIPRNAMAIDRLGLARPGAPRSSRPHRGGVAVRTAGWPTRGLVSLGVPLAAGAEEPGPDANPGGVAGALPGPLLPPVGGVVTGTGATGTGTAGPSPGPASTVGGVTRPGATGPLPGLAVPAIEGALVAGATGLERPGESEPSAGMIGWLVAPV